MRFIVNRTGQYDKEAPPCANAFRSSFPKWHVRTCSEGEFNYRFSASEGEWRANGKNHKVLANGYIARQEDDVERWSIELNTLEEIMAFIAENGQIIISEEDYNCPNPTIEIYDDYRE